MPELEEWLQLLHSDNRGVRVRAAKALLKREDVPLKALLEVLDHYSSDGLGAEAKRTLLKRNGPALLAPMIERLAAPHEFQREVACTVLGESGNWSITPRLLPMLDDPHAMVRRAAAFALASLGDPSVLDADAKPTRP